MLRWLSAQYLLTRWPSVCVLVHMTVCVFGMFLNSNQAHLQVFKSNTLKCQHSIL